MSQQWGCAAALLLASPWASASDCSGWTLSPSVGPSHSVWKEFARSGSQLLKESGTLTVTRLAGQLTCGQTQWRVDWMRAQGKRLYDGVTQDQKKVNSASDIDERAWHADVLFPLSEHWSGGVGIEQRITARHIRSTAQAWGYPERFTQVSALAGVRYKQPVSETTELSATAWAGRVFPGTMWFDPVGADPALLSLSAGRVWQASLSWGTKPTSTAGWSWSSHLHWRESSTPEGKSSALFNNGRLVGGARQPKTSTRSVEVLGGVSYAF